MTFRFDRAVIPPGLVSRARTYTLIVEDEKLYILNTGPAAGKGAAGLVGMGINSVYGRKIKQGEERIDNGDIRELVKEKHCALLTKDQITEVNLKEGRKEVALDVRAGRKKYQFLFPLEALPQVEELRSLLTT